MSIKTTILKNTAWLTGSSIINNIIGYILIVAIARNLGDVGLGQYSFIFAFTGLTFLASDFGLSYLMIKEISRNEKKAQYYFENIFSLKLILGLLSLFVTIGLSFFINKDPLVIRALWIVGLIQFFNVFSGFFGLFFNSFNRMDIGAISTSIERITALIFGLYFLITTKSLIFLAIALFISNFSKFIYLSYKIKTKVKFVFKLDFKILKKLLIDSFPFFLTGIFVFLYFRIDTVMLSLMVGDEVTGWYNAAYKLIDVLSVIPSILILAVLPSMSKLYKENKKLLSILFLRVFRYLIMLALPIGVGTFVLATRFMDFIYGTSFIGSSLSLQIIIWAEVFIFVNYLMGYLLNSIDKQKYFTVITGISAVFNIVLNFILIPKYSFIGAGIATVLTEILNFILLKRYVGINLVRIRITLPIIKSLIAALIMGIVIYNLSFLAIWYVVPIGAIVYGLSLLVMKLEKDDKELLVSIKRFKY